MPRNKLDEEFNRLRNEISMIAEQNRFNGMKLLGENETLEIEIPIQYSYEIKNGILYFYLPLNVANYLADISTDGHLEVKLIQDEALMKELDIDINKEMLEIYLSPAFAREFESIEIVYFEV